MGAKMKIKKIPQRQRQRNTSDRNLNFRVSDEQKAKMRKLACRYTDGNLSAWIIYAATELRPKKADLVSP